MIGSFRLTQIGEFQPTRIGVFRPTQFGEFHPTRTTQSETEENSRLIWEKEHNTVAPEPEPDHAKEYRKAFDDLQDAMKRLYQYAPAPQMATADIKHSMRDIQPPKKAKQPAAR